MIYDIIILGGGIAGLYTAYKLNKCSPHLKILLLEKENYLGGRVFTVHQGDMNVEAGAGRFADNHLYLMELLKELKLTSKMVKNGSEVAYAPANGQSRIATQLRSPEQAKLAKDFGTGLMYGSVSDAARFTGKKGCGQKTEGLQQLTIEGVKRPTSFGTNNVLLNNILTLGLGPSTLPNAALITKVVMASKLESRTYLQNQTFETYAKKVITKDEVDFIKQSFGYYSELVVMNAYDAIQLMVFLGPTNTFYFLKGGLSQVIEKMEEKLGDNVRILLQHRVKKIIHNDNNNNNDYEFERSLTHYEFERSLTHYEFEIITESKERTIHYLGKKCVCALPKQTLLTLSIFNPIKKLLNSVEYGTLCRIYCRFDTGKETGKVWFHGLPKFTTNNHLRMVIPYDEKSGVIMLSYTDNKYAEYWQRLYSSAGNHKEGIQRVNKKLIEQIGEVLGPKVHVPMPKYTRICYWKYGVGFWGVGADSADISEKMIQPISGMDLFVCGENYSEKWQQWMEGALETSQRVLRQLKVL